MTVGPQCLLEDERLFIDHRSVRLNVGILGNGIVCCSVELSLRENSKSQALEGCRDLIGLEEVHDFRHDVLIMYGRFSALPLPGISMLNTCSVKGECTVVIGCHHH